LIVTGINDASYNCKGIPTRRPSQIIPVAVALWATNRDSRPWALLHPRSRRLRRATHRSGYSAL